MQEAVPLLDTHPLQVQHSFPDHQSCAPTASPQRLPRGVVLQRRMPARRLAGRPQARLQGARRGAAAAQGGTASSGGG